MHRLVNPRHAVLAFMTVAIVLLGLVVSAGPASAMSVRITIYEKAGLAAGGAGVVLSVSISCSQPASGTLSYRATQKSSDGSIASAAAERRVSCSGTRQFLRLPATTVDPFSDPRTGRSLQTGSMFASVTADVCDRDLAQCATTRAARSVVVTHVTLDAPTYSRLGMVVALPASASLEAGGAGVTMRIDYTCPAGGNGGVSADLQQRVSPTTVVGGQDGLQMQCDGTARTAVLALHASRAAAWRAGKAFIIVSGAWCNPESCLQYAFLHRTVTVVDGVATPADPRVLL